LHQIAEPERSLGFQSYEKFEEFASTRPIHMELPLDHMPAIMEGFPDVDPVNAATGSATPDEPPIVSWG